MSVPKQVLILFALQQKFLDSVAVEEIGRWEHELFDYFDANHKDILDGIAETGQLPDKDKFIAAIKEFAETFQPADK